LQKQSGRATWCALLNTSASTEAGTASASSELWKLWEIEWEGAREGDIFSF
jgi:hypothetical protein